MSIERQDIIKLTKSMIEIPSVTGNTLEAEKILELIDQTLKSEGLVSQRFYSQDEKTGKTIASQLWGDKDTLLKPKLLLSGHIDVVSATMNQFKPRIDSERIYGRGAGDMKGHVASMILAYKNRIEELNGPKGVGLLLTSDEEVGGFNGTRYVIERAGLKADVVFIPDGEFSFDIVDSQKAPHHFHVRAISEKGGGHVSKSFMIDNPVNKIIEVYKEMRKKYSIASSKDEWKSSFEMTVFKTGNGTINIDKETVTNSANQIAEWADAWFGWRWPLEIPIAGKTATYDSGLKDLTRIAKKHGVQILGDDHGMGEGCYTDPKADFVQKWKAIIEPEIKREVRFQHMHGATDGRHFYKYGSKVLVTSAITEGAHSDNEWVDIDSLVKLANALYNYQQEITK